MRKKWIEKMAKDPGKWENRMILAAVVIGVALALGVYKFMGGIEAANFLLESGNKVSFIINFYVLTIGSALMPTILLLLLFFQPMRKKAKEGVKLEIIEELNRNTDLGRAWVLNDFLAQLKDGEGSGTVRKKFEDFKKAG